MLGNLMHLTDYQNTIFADRYALRGNDGQVVEANPDDMFTRVADAIGNNLAERKAFNEILKEGRFVPGGRILAGAGTDSEKTFYNCYVIPIETRGRRHNRNNEDKYHGWREKDAGSDSREAIFDTMANMVDIMSRGGGVGINWSVLRPAGSYLTRISGTSSGAVGWMDVASKAVGEVIQGGSRRGAAMFMLDDWHPDVQRFIEAKKTPGVIENANVSVAVSDEFMAAVRDDGFWTLRFPDTTDGRYNTDWDGDIVGWQEKGGRVKDYATLRARDLWASLVESAHASGEPGVVFLGRYNALSTAREAERIISVNPCGEQGLGAYSVCNLGSINLDKYVGKDGCCFEWDDFKQDVKVAIRFLDNVIDKTHYHLPETEVQQMRLRRIGLGVMGLADALIRLKLRYGHAKAVEFTEQVFKAMKDAAIEASMDLAFERGPAQAWRDDMWDRPYLKEYRERNPHREPMPLRNLFMLTQAPTGTTSAFAGVNGGIEPYFAFKFTRIDRTGTHEPVTEIQRTWQEAEEAGTPHGPEWVTASQVSGKEHLLMLAAAQKWIDSSVSKTVNLPKTASVQDVQEVYDLAWELGCKGLAVYVDESRSKQVLYAQDPNVRIAELEAELEKWRPRPSIASVSSGPTIHHPANNFDKPALPMIAFATQDKDVCPLCGGKVLRMEGCSKCSSCAWSAC
jgi:ribonucleoside-diphosphate reductase alpha chain